MGQTANYGLKQWESWEAPQREEVNGALAVIDAALATIPQLTAGAYTGNGAEQQTISCGFTPKAVYAALYNGESGGAGLNNNQCVGGLAVAGHPVEASRNTGSYVVAIVEGGFQVYNDPPSRSNDSGQVYHYIAIG